jgi:hypothetical protein
MCALALQAKGAIVRTRHMFAKAVHAKQTAHAHALALHLLQLISLRSPCTSVSWSLLCQASVMQQNRHKYRFGTEAQHIRIAMHTMCMVQL